MRIIGPECEFSSILQGDRYRVEPRNIIYPAVRRQVNSPAVLPLDSNRLASGNLRNGDSLANHSDAERRAQRFVVHDNPEFIKQDKTNQQD